MMKKDTSYEAPIKAAIKQTPLEKTRPDFVLKVMHKIKASESTAYTPLISKKAWFIGISGITIIILSIFYFTNDIKFLELPNFDTIFAHILSDISLDIHFSKNMIYGIFFATVMILLQLPLIKSRYYGNTHDR